MPGGGWREMSDMSFDCAVIGTGLLPALVAALLASEHGKRVALVGQHRSSFQLPRQLPIAIGLMTRPESLKLLQRLRDETVKLLGGLGKGLADRHDVLFVAETPDTVIALSHFRHLSRALGWSTEPATDHKLPDASLVRVRDVTRLVEARLASVLDSRLEELGVRRIAARELALAQRRDAAPTIVADGEQIVAARVLLADDAALLAHGPAAITGRLLVEVPMAALLVEDSLPLAAPAVLFPDRGLMLSRGDHGSVHVLAAGDPLSVELRIGATLAGDRPVRGAGEVRFSSLRTCDGAPFVGQVKGDIHAVAGLGTAAPFLAPLIARMLAGASSEEERTWLANRGAARPAQRALVVDYQAALP